jgi:serine/threonine-protein kinase
MPDCDTDRNLLFGVLTVQAGLLDPARFTEACIAWSACRDSPLADLLVKRGWLTLEGRADVEGRLDRELRRQDGEPRGNQIAAPAAQVQQHLSDKSDPETNLTLDSPGSGTGAAVSAATDVPAQLGARYAVRRQHGGGGLATIWVVHDSNLGRDVALKQLRPERAARPELVARFLQEAQITGQLEHPGIVPIYDLVRRSTGGHPAFYTMRFLKGLTLKQRAAEYHDRRRAGQAGPLELRELLNAFVAVCNAVAYAHSRSVLHRDLKGDNVMLGDFGEVIVLDWGLAKLQGPGGAMQTASAASAEIIQEDFPSASFPELTDSGTGVMTTLAAGVCVEGGRADTIPGQVMGTPAYMAPEQASGQHEQVGVRSDVYGLGAILYEILTGQPPFQGADTREILRQVCAQEPKRPRQHVAATPLALEAVCLKALAKKPEDRYASAEALANEVRRWLADQPVKAYREPWPVRTRRWVGRHRTLVTSTGAILLMAVLSLSLLTGLLSAANARERQAKDQAQANFRLARDTVERYCVKVSEDLRLRQEDLRPLRKELLEAAAEFLEKLKEQPCGDAELRRDRARAMQQLGFLTGEIGSPEDAIQYYTQARQVWTDLTRGPARVPDDQNQLAAVQAQLGHLFSRTDRLAQAQDALQEALATQRQLTESYPDVSLYRAELAATLNSLAKLYEKTKRLQEAEDAHQQALLLRQQLCQESPGVTAYKRGLAQTYDNLAVFYRNTGPQQLPQAQEAFEKALTLHRQLVASNPGVAEHQHGLAICCSNLGILYLYKKDWPKAEELYQESVDLYRQLVMSNSSVIDYRSALGTCLHNLGNLYRYSDRLERAEETYKESLAIRKKLVELQPTVLAHQMNLGRSYNNLGILLEQTGRPEKSQENFQHAVNTLKPLAGPGNIALYREDLVRSYRNLGDSYRASGDFAKAQSAFQESAALNREEMKKPSSEADAAVELADDYNNLAKLMNDKHDPAAALEWSKQAQEVLEPLLEKSHNQADARQVLAGAYVHRARALTLQSQYSEALKAWDKAIGLTPERASVVHRFGRASTMAQAGQHAHAAADADGTVKQAKPAGSVLYNAACVHALAAAAAGHDATLSSIEQAKVAEKYLSRSVGLLVQAQKTGFFRDKANVAHLKKDSDLTSLRERTDFKKLVAELEAPK